MAEPLRDMYSPKRMQEIADILKKHYKKADTARFLKHFKTSTWNEAALKTRVRLIAEALHDVMPSDYAQSIEVLIPMSREMKWGYFSIFFPEYVERFGQSDWKTSMHALEHFTESSSGEFAIRPFIVKDETKAMKQMLTWSKSKNHHVRRLASEGCRPRLPWGMKLQSFVNYPSPILPVLEQLKNDPELYVRKSVANNLNDISKDHPALVLKIAKKWIGQSEHTDWIVKHALRGLLKAGNKEALALFGHEDASGMQVEALKTAVKKLKIGDTLPFTFDLINTTRKEKSCRVEYAIDYVKSNGSHSRKVFQISKTTVQPGTMHFKRKQKMEELTTRKHYAGIHHLYILVNGDVMSKTSFELLA